MPVIVGDNFKVRVFCRANDQQNQLNVLHYQVTQKFGVDAGDLQTFVTNLSTKLSVIYKSFIAGTSRYEGIQVVHDSLIAEAAVISASGNGTGTPGVDALAPQLAVLLSWRSAGSPIGTRGRTYLPSGKESDEDTNGKLTLGASIIYNAVGGSLIAITGIGVGGGTTVDVQLYIRRVVLGTISRHLVTNGILRNSFATQRRRSFLNRGDTNPF